MGRQLLCASFLLLSLLVVLVSSAENASPTRVASVPEEQRCQCISVTSVFIPFKTISSVHLISPRPGCSRLQVIATLKNGRSVCLDSEARWVKVIIRVMMSKAND
ncbi:alveolar macrophage chemotactic factor-like isoform X1 [Python bivittatus]|uniref:Alveolar macrophage chemotactic factor-like isoform X1 n=1 Tax=Python bivittatus TaxID=176946 RepID=A0A9F5J1D2_PYTBI|nr:alveolar macrophage chemotactic factor-like isoform X1 [Python bivittatus]